MSAVMVAATDRENGRGARCVLGRVTAGMLCIGVLPQCRRAACFVGKECSQALKRDLLRVTRGVWELFLSVSSPQPGCARWGLSLC